MNCNHTKIYGLIDNFVTRSLQQQQMDEHLPDYGGFEDPESLTYEPWLAAYLLEAYALTFLDPLSRHHDSTELIASSKAAISFLDSVQYEDGTFDCFFGPGDKRSACNSAFMVTPLASAYSLWGTRLADEYRHRLLRIVQNAGSACADLPMYTANHPWIAVGGLAAAYGLTQDPSYLEGAKRRLEKGVDINEEGVYSERSHNYALAVDLNFLKATAIFGFTYLLEHVKKNADFLLYNIYPNGEVVSEYSTRYDAEGNAGTYAMGALFFRLMAKRYVEPGYEWVARLLAGYLMSARLNEYLFHGTPISPDPTLNKDKVTNFFITGCSLPYLIKFLHEQPLEAERPPTRYRKYYPKSGIFRETAGDISYTVSSQPNMLGYRCGDIAIEGFRIAAQSLGWRLFCPRELVFDESEGRVGVHGVFQERWIGDREYEAGITAEVDFYFEPGEESLTIDLKIDGQEGALLLYEFGIRQKGLAELGERRFFLNTQSKLLLGENEYLKIHDGDSSIALGPGMTSHRATEDLSLGRQVWTPSASIMRLLIAARVPDKRSIKIFRVY